MELIRSFTGPTTLTRKQRNFALRRMLDADSRRPADVWRSGCASGIDTLAAMLGFTLDLAVELYVPFAPHNATLVSRNGWQADHVIRVPRVEGGKTADQYRARNHELVDGSHELQAFVWDDAFYRSGEWMTINIAKRLGVRIVLEVLPN